MNRHPLVSVILPVYNGQPYVSATLASALSQTYANLEVIVVDDGSIDGTRAAVESWAARDSRVRLITQTNAGVAAARNRAIAVSRGEFVAPLDADDIWEPTKIERQVRRMSEGGRDTGLVYAWWVWIDQDGALLDSSPRWHFEGDGQEQLLQVNYTGNASVPLFRKELVERVGGYDETLRARGAEGCEDIDLALKVSERARIAVEPTALVAYRRLPGGMSAGTGRMWRSYQLVIDGVRRRRAGVSAARIRRAEDQFALYLSGVSFWSRDYWRACRWGVRALRSRVGYQVLPHVIRRVVPTLWRKELGRRLHVAPGVRFGDWRLPDPRIPYHDIQPPT